MPGTWKILNIYQMITNINALLNTFKIFDILHTHIYIKKLISTCYYLSYLFLLFEIKYGNIVFNCNLKFLRSVFCQYKNSILQPLLLEGEAMQLSCDQ